MLVEHLKQAAERAQAAPLRVDITVTLDGFKVEAMRGCWGIDREVSFSEVEFARANILAGLVDIVVAELQLRSGRA